MSHLPDKTVQAAVEASTYVFPHAIDNAACVLHAAMNPALGPDRLVVAGEIVQEIVLWLWTSAPVEKVWQREEIADAVRARFGA